MTAATEKDNRSTVVVIYDDPVTRARALSACDYLVSQLWESVELDFHWWRTDFLVDGIMSRAAAHDAMGADFLVICSTGNELRSKTLETWFESWISERDKDEGVLIDLSPAQNAPVRLHAVLQGIAERGRFDYLASTQTASSTSSTGNVASILPPSVDRLSDRSRPPRFGLNE